MGNRLVHLAAIGLMYEQLQNATSQENRHNYQSESINQEDAGPIESKSLSDEKVKGAGETDDNFEEDVNEELNNVDF